MRLLTILRRSPWHPILPTPTRLGLGLLLGFLLVQTQLCGAGAQSVPVAQSTTGGAGQSAAPARAASEPVLRIGLSVEVSGCELNCDGKVRIWRRGGGWRGSVFGPPFRADLRPAPVDHGVWSASRGVCPVADWGLRLTIEPHGALGTFPEELIFEPLSSAHPIRVDGRPYRGEILVRVATPSRLTVINAIRMEDYLCGVVPREIGSEGVAPAALRAQAIAARSYALFYLGRRGSVGCDLLAGPEDQVYGGIAAEQLKATHAVVATRGVVAVWEGTPIRANYSSTCGGATESADRIWRGESYPYLRAVRDRSGSGDPFCAESRYFRWEERWSCAQLQQIISKHLPREVPKARGRELGRLRGLKAKKRSPSGRVEELEIQMEGGNFKVHGDRIRWVLRRPDGGLLRSTWIGKLRVERGGDGRVTLEGAGYGHGVGMCQVGAMELARRGLSAPQILRHYYRGITLERWW